MLDAYLQDTEDFPEMLHYCNVLYEYLPMILNGSHLRGEKDARKLAAIAVVAAGYGGDMGEELVNDLLDDMNFVWNRVKCWKRMNPEALQEPRLRMFKELLELMEQYKRNNQYQ